MAISSHQQPKEVPRIEGTPGLETDRRVVTGIGIGGPFSQPGEGNGEPWIAISRVGVAATGSSLCECWIVGLVAAPVCRAIPARPVLGARGGHRQPVRWIGRACR